MALKQPSLFKMTAAQHVKRFDVIKEAVGDRHSGESTRLIENLSLMILLTMQIEEAVDKICVSIEMATDQ